MASRISVEEKHGMFGPGADPDTSMVNRLRFAASQRVPPGVRPPGFADRGAPAGEAPAYANISPGPVPTLTQAGRYSTMGVPLPRPMRARPSLPPNFQPRPSATPPASVQAYGRIGLPRSGSDPSQMYGRNIVSMHPSMPGISLPENQGAPGGVNPWGGPYKGGAPVAIRAGSPSGSPPRAVPLSPIPALTAEEVAPPFRSANQNVFVRFLQGGGLGDYGSTKPMLGDYGSTRPMLGGVDEVSLGAGFQIPVELDVVPSVKLMMGRGNPLVPGSLQPPSGLVPGALPTAPAGIPPPGGPLPGGLPPPPRPTVHVMTPSGTALLQPTGRITPTGLTEMRGSTNLIAKMAGGSFFGLGDIGLGVLSYETGQDCPAGGDINAYCDCQFPTNKDLNAKCKQGFDLFKCPLCLSPPWTDVGAGGRSIPKPASLIATLVGGTTNSSSGTGSSGGTSSPGDTTAAAAPSGSFVSRHWMGLAIGAAAIGGVGLVAASRRRRR